MISIRKYKKADAEVLASLFYDTVHEINGDDYPPEQLDAWAPAKRDMKKWREKLRSSKTIVASLEGRIVGFANLGDEKSSVGMLYVHKDYQGESVGTVLLNTIEKKLKKRKVGVAIVEASITARPFFEQRGYRYIRENQRIFNGTELLNFIMEKKLTLKPGKGLKDKSKEKKTFRWRDLFRTKIF